MSIRIIAFFAAVAIGALLFLKGHDAPDQPAAVSNPSQPPDAFLQGVDFTDGAKYVLVLYQNGVHNLIDQHQVLQSYKDKIVVSGLNWLAFIPGQRGRAETSILLYRNGETVLQGSSHRSKHFDFSDIAQHGITVRRQSFYENKSDIKAILKAMRAADAPQVFLVDQPSEFKPHDFTLKTDLPTFWVSSEILQSEIKADFHATILVDISSDERVRTLDLSLNRHDFVQLTDTMGVAILNADRVPVTLGGTISFYRPKLTISCSQERDCNELRVKIIGLSDDVLKLRDAELLDGLEHPLFPEHDENDSREFSLDMSITDRPWIQITENKYSLSFFEEIK